MIVPKYFAFLIVTNIGLTNGQSNASSTSCNIIQCSSTNDLLCWSSDGKNFNQFIVSCKVIHFKNQDYELTKNLVIHDLEKFTVVGNGTSIHCRNVVESALAFVNITMLRISNITLVSCGAMFADLSITDASTLLLYNITSVCITNVTLINSHGYAVHTVRLQKAIFINVICHSHNSGGILMVYSNVSTNTITSHKSSLIIIDHCRFNGTYQCIISNSSSKHTGCMTPKMFTLVLKQEAGLVKVNISNTCFVSNNTPSILISYFNNTRSIISMSKCDFIINNSNPSTSPITTLKANNVFSNKKFISLHTMIIQYFRFVSPNTSFVVRWYVVKSNNKTVTMTFKPLLLYKRTILSTYHWNLQVSSKNKVESLTNFTVIEACSLTFQNVSKLKLTGRKVSFLEYVLTDCDYRNTTGNYNRSICYCKYNQTNCSKYISTDESVHPGQSITIPLITFSSINTSVYVVPYLKSQDSNPVCGTATCGIPQQYIYRVCTNISYTIKSRFTKYKWCLLHLELKMVTFIHTILH